MVDSLSREAFEIGQQVGVRLRTGKHQGNLSGNGGG